MNQHIRFGTDGIRGPADTVVTPKVAFTLGQAVGLFLGDGPVLVGRDTRLSGPGLEQALAQGLASRGLDVALCGVVTTPALAWLASRRSLPAAMISASHNPFADNGVKLFASGGYKLDDSVEKQVEAELHRLLDAGDDGAVGGSKGTVSDYSDPMSEYEAALINSIEGRDLSGLKIVIDAANGSASTIAPRLLNELGAEVISIAVDPDGRNINAACGSTYPEQLQAAVLREDADFGFAFDGDADRMLAVDAEGQLIDGDQLMAIFALDLHDRGLLADDTVVVTVMSNLGFRLSMQRAGIKVVETALGDKFVLRELRAGDWSLGGEQSGHIIFTNHAVTGDGLLCGVLLGDLVKRRRKSLLLLAKEAMSKLPQVLVNVSVGRRIENVAEELSSQIADARAELGESGRVLVRASGTEPLVRVMVEAPTDSQANEIANRLAAAATEAFG